MKDYVPSRSPCAVGRASRLLGDRWVLLILREAFLGIDRFEDFLGRLDISRAALTSRLGWMVEAGVLERIPPEGKRALYRLTASGQALRPTYDAIKAWGDEWLPRGTKENGPGDAGPSIY
ncbi:MAG: helix-turn-helix transcriptional regulator [Sphingopyxis sp.]|nr:helix-turn-helix transcriptional regulator [Sphingopyxis sp.]